MLLGIFIICELIVFPVGEFPLNDGCTYARSVLILVQEGRLYTEDWQATVVTNIIWGALFVKIMGWSFFALRLSTIVMAAGGILFMYALALRLSSHRLSALCAAFTLMFNPYFFHLGNVFMTDAAFTTLMLACCYFAIRYIETDKILWGGLLLISSIALILLRQYGLIVPFAFLGFCVLQKTSRLRNIASGLVIVTVSCLALWLYETYITSISGPQGNYRYVFAGAGEKTGIVTFEFNGKIRNILTQVLTYGSPGALLAIMWFAPRMHKWFVVLILVLSGVLYFSILKHTEPLPGNILADTGLGPDTFYENINDSSSRPDHTSSPSFVKASWSAKKILCTTSIFAVLLAAAAFLSGKREVRVSYRLLPALMMLLYCCLLVVTPGSFDRYYLPPIALVILLFIQPVKLPGLIPPAIIIAALGYVSVAGTKDYFTLNRNRWSAYNYVKDKLGAGPAEVNAGFEPKCWDSERFSWMYDANVIEGQKYLIQYTKEEGFEKIRSYPFKRYLPPKKDTVFIFRRIHEK